MDGALVGDGHLHTTLHGLSMLRDDLDEDVYENTTNWTWPLAGFLADDSKLAVNAK